MLREYELCSLLLLLVLLVVFTFRMDLCPEERKVHGMTFPVVANMQRQC